MEITKTRDAAAAEEAARIWAHATALRDDNPASTQAFDSAVPLIQETLNSSDRSFLLTLFEDGKMLSFAAIEPSRASDANVGEVRYLGVAPGHWGEGWARRLLVALPGALRDGKFTSSELWVYADNIRAIFVYEAMGWTRTSDTRRHAVTGRVEQKYVLKLG